MVELKIKVNDNQVITIYPREFLGVRQITRVKKLIRIIRSSQSPEVEDNLKVYVKEQLWRFRTERSDTSKKIVWLKGKIKEREFQVTKKQLPES